MKTTLRLLFTVYLASLPAQAWSGDNDQLDVAIEIGGNRMDLDFAGDRRDTRFDFIEVRWYERLLSHLDGGVTLGYLDVSQAANPLPAAQSTSGQFLEVGLRAYVYQSDFLELVSDIRYRYSSTSGSLSGQDIDWSWHQGSIGLQTALLIASRVRFTAGISATTIDGEQTATGPVTQITDFGEEKSLSAHAGARLTLDHTGHVGIEISSGSLRGGRIYFQRWF